MGLKAVKGVLHNFLGAYTSRNSDYDGYWLMGMLINDLNELRIDLLLASESTVSDSPLVFAIHLARRSFREQMRKAGLGLTRIREGYLNITKLSDSRNGWINDRECIGNTIRFAVKVVMVTGKACERETEIVVALHNPDVERRSVRRLS